MWRAYADEYTGFRDPHHSSAMMHRDLLYRPPLDGFPGDPLHFFDGHALVRFVLEIYGFHAACPLPRGAQKQVDGAGTIIPQKSSYSIYCERLRS
jgi:hypothetical protein